MVADWVFPHRDLDEPPYPDGTRVLRPAVPIIVAAGVPAVLADIVLARFGSELAPVRTALDDLRDNFADVAARGAVAYADEMLGNHPDLEQRALLADGVTAVGEFHWILSS